MVTDESELFIDYDVLSDAQAASLGSLARNIIEELEWMDE